ncbi:MAG: SGNH/GDSL hydrolase family protein [Actinomycetota bacterium]|nr:SGNH/GDSL hydrolase family protein [Actinomycetota bacterium]
MSLLRPGALVALSVVAVLLTGCAALAPMSLQRQAASASTSASPAPSSSAILVADPTVVAIGDSIMKGHGLKATAAWPALMAVEGGWRLDNLACDGAGFLAVGNDSDCAGTFADLVATTVALHPRTVIIEGSSNDFGESNDVLMPETDSQLAELRAALPNAQIIGLSTIWGDTAVPAQLADVDKQVKNAVTKVGGTFLDIGQPLSGHPEWMQSDDVHPTAAGQLAIYGAVQTAFNEAHLRA